jgi:hypothetical protein
MTGRQNQTEASSGFERMSRDLLVVVSLFMKLLHEPPTRAYTGISVLAANNPQYTAIEDSWALFVLWLAGSVITAESPLDIHRNAKSSFRNRVLLLEARLQILEVYGNAGMGLTGPIFCTKWNVSGTPF